MFNWFRKNAPTLKEEKAADARTSESSYEGNQIAESKALLKQGNAFLESGRLDEAAECYRRAIAQNPDYSDAYTNLGHVLQRQGKLDEAIPLYRKAIEITPDHLMAHQNLGFLLMGLGRSEAAEESLCRVVALAPEHVGALHNLGVIAAQRGDFPQAEALLFKATELQPGGTGDHVLAKADIYFHLGDEASALGKYEEAVSFYQKAIKRNPGHVFAHVNIAIALLELGLYDEVETYSRKAIALAPETYEAYNNLGAAFHKRGQYAEAYSCFRRALEIKPDCVDTLCNLGETCTLSGKFDEAASCYRRALEIKPDHVLAMICLGKDAINKGRFDEANDYFQRALSIDPDSPVAWAALVDLRKMTPEDGEWLSTAERLVKKGLPVIYESYLRFAMGKYCDDVKHYDEAFAHYFRANELSRSMMPRYDRKKQTQLVDDLIKAYGWDQVNRVHKGSSSSARPVFIVGMPRSGTSLLEQIIASHPEALGAGELLYFNDAFNSHEEMVRNARLEESLLSELANKYLQLLSGFSEDAKIVVDKMPINFLWLGLIHAVFPNARIIHTQRNPVDTCLSNYFQNFSAAYSFTSDLADLAHYYGEYRRLMSHWRKVLPSNVFLEVAYEELTQDQEKWSRAIIEFIGLDWDERCLNFHQTERQMATASNWQVRQKMYKSSVERWRNYEKFVGPLIGLLDFDGEGGEGGICGATDQGSYPGSEMTNTNDV